MLEEKREDISKNVLKYGVALKTLLEKILILSQFRKINI